MRLRDYRSHVGVVMQDNFLFDGTIHVAVGTQALIQQGGGKLGLGETPID